MSCHVMPCDEEDKRTQGEEAQQGDQEGAFVKRVLLTMCLLVQ